MLNNLLTMAFTLIPPEKVQYQKWIGNAVNELGLDVASYSEPVEVEASIQAVQNNLYQQLGLDLAKEYKKVLLPAKVVGVSQQKTPDRFTFYGKNWIVVNDGDWTEYNGWCRCIVVAEKDYVG